MAGDDPTGTSDAPAGAPGDALPDWHGQAHELHCPMCEYDLHGLEQPRCPECGFRFQWKDLLDVNRRAHPYLFEHHPEANFKSFWKTAWGGLRPWRFWRELHPVMPSKPARLLVYWFVSVLVGFGAVIGWAIPAARGLAAAAVRERARFTQMYSPQSLNPAFLQGMLDKDYPLPPRPEFFEWLWRSEPTVRIVASMLVVAVAWPWLTFLTLMIFRLSMRRARVRSIHVLRCVIYSFDSVLWLGALLILLPLAAAVSGPWAPNSMSIRGAAMGPNGRVLTYVLEPYRPAFGNYRFERLGGGFLPLTHVLLAALLAFGAVRLVLAYQRYLRFDWPRTTVLTSQVILLLIAAIMALNIRDSDLMWYWRYLIGM